MFLTWDVSIWLFPLSKQIGSWWAILFLILLMLSSSVYLIRERYSFRIVSNVSRVPWRSKIPPLLTLSRNQSFPKRGRSSRSIALRSAISKQLIIVNISCERRRFCLYKVIAFRLSFPHASRYLFILLLEIICSKSAYFNLTDNFILPIMKKVVSLHSELPQCP